MDLKQYYWKMVKIVDMNHQVHYGKVTDYFLPEDNEPEGESIVIDSLSGDLLEFREEYIETIEVIK